MTNAERTARWRRRYNREVANMTSYYEKLNAQAPTIVRKATPEETAFYINIIEKQKGRN